jgi:hypothetical protein
VAASPMWPKDSHDGAVDLADTSGSNCLPVRFTATDKAYSAVTPLNTGALMTLVGRAGRAGGSTI